MGAFISVILPFQQSEQSFGDLEPIGGNHSTIIIHWGPTLSFGALLTFGTMGLLGPYPSGSICQIGTVNGTRE